MPSSSSLFLFHLIRQRAATTTTLLHHHHRHLLPNFNILRHMGGGPRTFPGGLSKWKYRRMHEKLAREKERKLLDQEKQLYEARLRSEIRAQVGTGYLPPGTDDQKASLPYGGPMSSKDHVKSLADRFMKEGAVDLWNEDDGPLELAQVRNMRPPPIEPRKSVPTVKRDSWSKIESFYLRREYSSFARRGLGSGSSFTGKFRPGKVVDTDSDSDSGYSLETQGFGKLRFGNTVISDEEEEKGSGVMRKKMKSAAALGSFDKKKTRRVSIDLLEKITFEQEVEGIRKELQKRTICVNGLVEKEDDQESIFTDNRFDGCNMSPLTTKALTSAGYEQMTLVQAEALPICLDGKDVLVKAKSGTGKSFTFLLPAIEAVLKATNSTRNRRVFPILSLILCPTRELASQIAAEANVLLKHHNGINIQTLIGGTRFKVDQKLLESNPPQIVVATPGRLLDHIETKAGFSVRLMGLKALVVDEVDHLLDLGFRSDIEKIVDCLPQQRQTLLFSATIPKQVRRVSQLVLNKDHVFVDTVGLTGPETHDKVSQSYIVSPHEDHFEIVYHLLKEHITQDLEYKVIIFCTTAMMTSLMYTFLRNMKMNVREIHSRKPQVYRARISDEFRESKRLILVTSDVSARGMDYPDVTLVLQVGIPSDREQYIHRLGRTGRKGQDGKGVMLLAPWEEYFMDEIKDLPVSKFRLPECDPEIKPKVEASLQNIDTGVKEAAYHSWLGYYNSISEIGRDKTNLVELANRFCGSINLEKPPPLFRKTALKMGLKGISGIKLKN